MGGERKEKGSQGVRMRGGKGKGEEKKRKEGKRRGGQAGGTGERSLS